MNGTSPDNGTSEGVRVVPGGRMSRRVFFKFAAKVIALETFSACSSSGVAAAPDPGSVGGFGGGTPVGIGGGGVAKAKATIDPTDTPVPLGEMASTDRTPVAEVEEGVEAVETPVAAEQMVSLELPEGIITDSERIERFGEVWDQFRAGYLRNPNSLGSRLGINYKTRIEISVVYRDKIICGGDQYCFVNVWNTGAVFEVDGEGNVLKIVLNTTDDGDKKKPQGAGIAVGGLRWLLVALNLEDVGFRPGVEYRRSVDNTIHEGSIEGPQFGDASKYWESMVADLMLIKKDGGTVIGDWYYGTPFLHNKYKGDYLEAGAFVPG